MHPLGPPPGCPVPGHSAQGSQPPHHPYLRAGTLNQLLSKHSRKALVSPGVGGRRLAKWGSRGPGVRRLPLSRGSSAPFFLISGFPLRVAQAAARGSRAGCFREICEHIKGTSAETLRPCKELTETYCLRSAGGLFTQSQLPK